VVGKEKRFLIVYAALECHVIYSIFSFLTAQKKKKMNKKKKEEKGEGSSCIVLNLSSHILSLLAHEFFEDLR
jgi:hypothetical protein